MNSGIRVLALATSLAFTACSATPTAPSVSSQAALIGVIPQEAPPVPPRVGVTPPAALGATRFVAFGDSITYGEMSLFDGRFHFDAPAHAYPARLSLALNQYHPPQRFSVVNAGLGSELAHNAESRLLSTITTHNPQVLLLLQGVNDLIFGYSPSAAAAALGRIIDVARAHQVVVMVATMPQTYQVINPDGDRRDNAYEQIVPYNAEVRRLIASRSNVYLVDLHRAFGSDRRLIGGDGIHPTEEGYQLIATTMLAAIEAAFPVRGSFQ